MPVTEQTADMLARTIAAAVTAALPEGRRFNADVQVSVVDQINVRVIVTRAVGPEPGEPLDPYRELVT